MHLKYLVLGVLVFSSLGYADLDSTIVDQKEQGLEADDIAMEIHDVESEQKLAREQARAEEEMKSASDVRLRQLRNEKEKMADQYKLDISLSEARRKKAEEQINMIKKETALVRAQIKALQAAKDKAEKEAIDAKAIAEAGRETLIELKQKMRGLEVDTRHANFENKKAQIELAQLRAQSLKMQQAQGGSQLK